MTGRPAGERMRVLVAGAGAAALELVLALHAAAADRLQVELIAPEAHFSYQPLAAVGALEATAGRLALDRLALCLGMGRRCESVARLEVRDRRAWTTSGACLDYDAFVLACSPRIREAVPGSLTYRGRGDAARVLDVLAAVLERRADRLAFVAPAGAVWTLPAYELALGARRWLRTHDADADVTVVTAEHAPLELLGEAASSAMATLLRRERIGLRTGSEADCLEDGRLRLSSGAALRADRAVALGERVGRAPAGVPRDAGGFVEVDAGGRAIGAPDVYAVGEAVAGSLDLGGVGTRQADAVAADIAARAGAAIPLADERPLLRGLLLTGPAPSYLAPAGRTGGDPDPAPVTLWWPPPELDGRHLAARLAGDLDLAAPPSHGHVVVERLLGGSPRASAASSLSVRARARGGARAVSP